MLQVQFHTEELQRNLREFGLNPGEWILIPLEESQEQIQFELNSIEEPDLVFLGKAQKINQSLRWQSLEWQSY